MFKKIQNKLQEVKKAVVAGLENNPMKKYVDIALADGSLTKEEEEDLYRQAEKVNMDPDELKFYIASRLEEIKEENWVKMKAMVQEVLKGNAITDQEKEWLFNKAEALHLDEVEFSLYYNGQVKELDQKTAEIESIDKIPDTVREIQRLNVEVENDREKRRKVWDKRIEEIKGSLKTYEAASLNLLMIKSWWDAQSKSEKSDLRKLAGVASKFLGSHTDQELKQMYYKSVLEDKHEALKKEATVEIKQRIEGEYELIKQEKMQLNDALITLQAIPREYYKTYKIEEVIKKLQANLKVEISLNLNVNLDLKIDGNFIEKLFDGADKLLKNPTVKSLLKIGTKMI